VSCVQAAATERKRAGEEVHRQISDELNRLLAEQAQYEMEDMQYRHFEYTILIFISGCVSVGQPCDLVHVVLSGGDTTDTFQVYKRTNRLAWK
jgi:hypothetical protein